MTSSKKFREKYQRILFFEKRSFHQDCPPQISFKTFRVHMILSFENRSFHEYRPPKFRLKYLNIASKRAARKTFALLQSRCLLLKFVILRHIAPHVVVEKRVCFNIAPKR